MELEDYKKSQHSAINDSFHYATEVKNVEVLYKNEIYQADKKSRERLLFMVNNNTLPENFYWLDKNNNKNYLTKEELFELLNLMNEKYFYYFNKMTEIKNMIRNLNENSEESERIKINSKIDIFNEEIHGI